MNPESSDERLLAAFLAGNRRALEQLAARYELGLLGLARGLLGGRRDVACDAVQETWLRVIRFAASFQGRSSFKTWIYRIAINQCRSLRDARPDGAGGEPFDDHGSLHGSAATAPSNDEQTALRVAVAALDPDKRDVVLLCYHNGMSHADAAEILGIPVGTLKSRLHAALSALRERLHTEAES